MCGRVRLSSDVSEIKLVFSIPPERGPDAPLKRDIGRFGSTAFDRGHRDPLKMSATQVNIMWAADQTACTEAHNDIGRKGGCQSQSYRAGRPNKKMSGVLADK